MTDFDRFVGIPYLDRGRDARGCDCWGLAVLVTRELLGAELPSYCDRYVTGADRKAIAELVDGVLSQFVEVLPPAAQAFDLVLMREGRLTRHVGIMPAPGLVLHVSEGGTSCIERLDSPRIRNRVVGFCRWAGHAWVH